MPVTEPKSGSPVERSIYGEIRLCKRVRGRRREVELWLLNDVVTLNKGVYTKLEENMSQFADTPILVAYVGDQIGDGHNFTQKETEDGKIVASFMDATAERIVGYFRDTQDIRIENEDGKTWVVGKGYIWEWYAKELVDKLENLGRSGMPISIETLVYEYRVEKRDDKLVEVYDIYEILGTTILGEEVSPAVIGAHIKALSAIGAKNLKDLTLKVASKIEKNTNPQKKTQKGETSIMKMNEIEKQFPDHTVVAIEGDNVALLSENGTPLLSTCAKVGDEIVVGAKAEAKSTTVFESGEVSMTFATDEIIDRLNAKCVSLSAEKAEAEKERKTLADTLCKMQTAEKARRKEACKTAVKNRLADINRNRKNKIEETVCNSLLSDEMLESFSVQEDSEGRFVGDSNAVKELDSLCMAEIIREGETIVANNQKRFPWEIPVSGNEGGSDLQQLADRLENNIE